MFDETTIRRAAARANRSGPLPSLYLWFYKRVFSTALLALVTLSLLYIHFFIPNGLAGLTPNLIISRWDDPTWGLFWRLFDWLLVGLGVLRAAELVAAGQPAGVKSGRFWRWSRGLIFAVGGLVMVFSAQVIFGPRG